MSNACHDSLIAMKQEDLQLGWCSCLKWGCTVIITDCTFISEPADSTPEVHDAKGCSATDSIQCCPTTCMMAEQEMVHAYSALYADERQHVA